MGGLRRQLSGHQGRQGRNPYLDGQLGGHATVAAHIRFGKREHAALESGWPLPFISFWTQRQGPWLPSLALGPQGRRGPATHRRQGEALALWLVSRCKAAGAGNGRSRSQ